MQNREHEHLPDADRLSILAATIMLAYAFTPFIKLPVSDLTLQLPGFLIDIPFNFSSLVSVIVAGMAAAGADWLLRTHPYLGKHSTLPHLIIPALTAWAIGMPLNAVATGSQWWAVFGLGSLLFVMVLISEYVVVDNSDTRHAPATVGLTGVAVALLLVLAISVRASGFRVYLEAAAIVPSAALVALRALYLRLSGKWCVEWGIGIGVVTGQIAIALHYLPLNPLQFGLIVVGVAYALISLAGALEEQQSRRTLWIESAISLGLFTGLALLIG